MRSGAALVPPAALLAVEVDMPGDDEPLKSAGVPVRTLSKLNTYHSNRVLCFN